MRGRAGEKQKQRLLYRESEGKPELPSQALMALRGETHAVATEHRRAFKMENDARDCGRTLRHGRRCTSSSQWCSPSFSIRRIVCLSETAPLGILTLSARWYGKPDQNGRLMGDIDTVAARVQSDKLQVPHSVRETARSCGAQVSHFAVKAAYKLKNFIRL